MVMISERPAEAKDRAVPGHWEGDLIIGKDCKSAVGTLVERTTRCVLLLHLPAGRGAEGVEAAMRRAIATLPGELFRTVTWDQGKEMAFHARFTIASGIPVYFCDPHKPLLDGYEVDGLDVRCAGQQVGRHFGQRGRYLAVDVRGASVAGGKGVEDAVAGVANLERVPGDGAFLGDGQVPAGLEECRQLVALTSLSFQQC
jgi:Integrase core domain